jgi:hypothetical protein
LNLEFEFRQPEQGQGRIYFQCSLATLLLIKSYDELLLQQEKREAEEAEYIELR